MALRSLTASVLAVAALAGACSDDGTVTGGADPGPGPTTPTTMPEPGVVASVDWTTRAVTIDGSDWRVVACDGDAPLLCLTGPDGETGSVELSTFPADTHDPPVAADDVARLRALATEFLADLATDRESGCGDGTVLRPGAVTDAPFGGRDGVRVEFAVLQGGAVTERGVSWFASDGAHFHVLGASALTDDACLSREFNEFRPADIDAVLPTLDALAAGSRWPA